MAKRGGKKLSAGASYLPYISPGIFMGSLVKVADNSGARIAKVIGVLNKKTVKRRVPGAGVGGVVVVSIREGKPELRKQIFHAIVIRQKKPYRRVDGSWIQFEDNAVALITPEGDPKGSEIRGPVAREAAERWVKISNIASIVI